MNRSPSFLFQLSLISSAVLAGNNALSAELEHTPPVVEEIIVTSTLHRSQADTTLPVNILTGESLRERVGATLGDTLQDQVGVTTASFGPGVGAPVIRGQSGNRVQVLQGGVGNIDASAISADHANSLEPALAERIEVLRGPATLLYGNGAIGGVVNVIDNRIPTARPDGIEGLLETRHDSASDQQVSVMKLEGALGNLAWHVDGIYRDSNDLRVAGYALNPALLHLEDAEDQQRLRDSRGHIANSNARATVKTVGGSWLLDEGYVGLSVNHLQNDYGIPNGLGHGHEAGEEEGDIRIHMTQERRDFETRLPLGGWFQEFHGRISQVDYEHSEIEGDGAVGTVFKQRGSEGRFAFHLEPAPGSEGVVGLHVSQREFSALGEEAFIPATDIDSTALFLVHSVEVGDSIYEFGVRGEQRELQQREGACGADSLSWSGSASTIWHFREDSNFVVALAHSQRAATVEELYSNIAGDCQPLADERLIAHAATQRLEIGLPGADKERSTNIEVALRKHMGPVTGEFTVYQNNIADYLYLFDTGATAQGVEIARYRQDDTIFRGFELQVDMPLLRTGDHLYELGIFGDRVRAEFRRGGNVPRIPPLSYGLELRHSHLDWQAKLRVTKYAAQADVGSTESRTRGYTLVGFYADYHLGQGDSTTYLFLKGSNLLDATVRQHTSLLKDVAPAAGRAFEVGLRWEF